MTYFDAENERQHKKTLLRVKSHGAKLDCEIENASLKQPISVIPHFSITQVLCAMFT